MNFILTFNQVYVDHNYFHRTKVRAMSTTWAVVYINLHAEHAEVNIWKVTRYISLDIVELFY